MTTPGNGTASELAEVNENLASFFQHAEHNAGTPVHDWFTLEQAHAIGYLLRQGEGVLMRSPCDQQTQRQRELYGHNLRRLTFVLHHLQEEMQQFCFLLASQQQHVLAVRSWMSSQRPAYGGR